MKKIILFGIGNNGRVIVEAYEKYSPYFKIIAIADNNAKLVEFHGIKVILPKEIKDYEYDEIWISTIYYEEITNQLLEKLKINSSKIRYVEYPMLFLEQQIYDKYREELAGVKKCQTDEKQQIIDYIIQNGVKMYCYSFYDEYMEKDVPVYLDDKNGMYYGIFLSHKMYLSRKLDTLEKAKNYFRYTFMEQDIRSPHCYLTEAFQIKEGEVGIDIGAAEGVFALSVLDKVKHIYMIEADENWCEALNMTFQDFKEKVTIIKAYVSNQDCANQIKLDTEFYDKKVDFIKMDIEGAEQSALIGAEHLIERNSPKLAICTYHHSEDNQVIGEWLQDKGYNTKNSNGYVICQGEWELQDRNQVDFRRALLWAEREK